MPAIPVTISLNHQKKGLKKGAKVNKAKKDALTMRPTQKPLA